ncbi:conserved hypothetical protein [Tenacibaculum sp. 190130A14a]|uniref:hypothetical protein n=1 Tax=Tenacibaculum polynesiense TaxID=3137857 RepID=UPI0032012077
MEKTFRTFSVLLIIIAIGCGSTKQSKITNTQAKIDSIFVKKDSAKHITIHSAIKDMVFVSFSTGDTKLDSLVSQKLQHFKAHKKSGTNSFKVRYDAKAQGFEITSEVGATKEVIERKHDSISKHTHVAKTKEKEKLRVKHQMPLWFWVLLLVIAGVIYVGSKFNMI